MVTPITFFPGFLRTAVIVILTIFVVAAGSTSGTAAELKAGLDRESVPAGGGAQFTIEIKDGDARPPQIPEVPGFIFQGPNRGRQMSLFNGQASSSTTYSYVVGSLTPGDYTIPAITVIVDGQEMQTQPLKLKVTPSANQPPQGLPPGSAGASPPKGSDPAEEEDSSGFLTVELAAKDRRHAWVGEIAPVRIKAWFPPNARISLASSLQPDGSAFTLHNVGKEPQQAVETRNGRQYRVLTWYGGLSAAKAGTYPPDLTLKASLQVRERTARRQRAANAAGGRDPFNDPFFDDFFARMVQKDIVLSSNKDGSSDFEVRPLPATGKPADFSGAVGKFALGETVIPDKWQTGEPQQITAAVTGEGNFNLLAQPALVPADNWKTYPGQSDFTAKDVASFAGTQKFRLNAVPRKGGSQKLHLTFSYFDPETGRYETVNSPEKQIVVSGADVQPKEEPAAAAAVAPKPALPDPLAPQHNEDTGVRSLTPIAFRPSFRAILGGCGAAVLLGFVIGRLRSVRNDPARTARHAAESATRLALQEAESLAARGDVPGFFAAARRALQVRLATLWGRQAHAITLADVASRVPADSPVVEIFREADRVAFSPLADTAANDLTTSRALLHRAMKSLTASGATDT